MKKAVMDQQLDVDRYNALSLLPTGSVSSSSSLDDVDDIAGGRDDDG